MASRPAMTLQEAEERLARDGADFAGLVAKGDHYASKGDLRSAGSFYATALSSAQSGRPADRIEVERLFHAIGEIQEHFVAHVLRSLAEGGHTQANWHPRFGKALGMMLGGIERQPPTEPFPVLPTQFYYPDLPYVEFADRMDFPWHEAVEARTEAMAEEAAALLVRDGSFRPYVRMDENRPEIDTHGMADNKDWSSFELFEMGRPVDEHVGHAPTCFETIIEVVPLCTIPGRTPTLLMSLLKPGKKIPPHHGQLNPRYICHLPLIVPGDGALRLGTQTREWEKARLLIFDDTIEHEAWNNSSQDRVVLLFDTWRPELEPIEREQIASLFAAVDTVQPGNPS